MNGPMTSTDLESTPTHHWADKAAEELIRLHPEKSPLVCASGISPSGVVHIGNFREVITVDFVVRSLRSKGRKVRFIYSWDDYDALRKVPANLPNPEKLEPFLRKPVSAIPDPYGEYTSYATHFEKRFEKEIEPLGIAPEFIYQNEAYRNGRYREGIRTALAHQAEAVKALNACRTEPLPADWTCVSIFCKKCGKDVTKLLAYEAPNTFKYQCKICKEDFTLDLETEAGVKLLWRVDWPMRWAHEGVDFEPGGKDHSSTGGSYETGAEIIRRIWKKEPPFYVQYDFVMAKGLGGKFSSSSGNLMTLSQALEVYEPQIVRWLFASRKPNMDFSIAFDLDVMKAYDDFDRTERFAYGMEEGDEKKISYEKRIYEMSLPFPEKAPQTLPAQVPFRHLCNILQIYEGNLADTKAFFSEVLKSPYDEERFDSRATRAWNWIQKYAPEAFRFALREATAPCPKSAYPEAMKALIEMLKTKMPLAEEALATEIYNVIQAHGLNAKLFFQDIYKILIDKTNGPRLASFLLAIGADRATALLAKAC